MEVTKQFLKNVRESQLKYWNITSYQTGGPKQHPKFPLGEMPIYTFLDDTESAFIYVRPFTHLNYTELIETDAMHKNTSYLLCS